MVMARETCADDAAGKASIIAATRKRTMNRELHIVFTS
jgi:hypothetical protein